MKPRVLTGELLFTVCMAAYVVVLAVLAFGYKPESRLFPLLVLAPTVVFLALRFISMANPKLSKVLEPDSGMIDIEKVQRFAKTTEEREVTEKDSTELKVILWTITLVVLVYLLGMLPAIALFVFLFVKFYGRRGIVISVAYTVATWIFVYIVFVKVLQATLYEGILGALMFQ